MTQSALLIFYSLITFLLVAAITLYIRKRSRQSGSKVNVTENENQIHGSAIKPREVRNNLTSEKNFETNIRGIYIAGELGGMSTLNSAALQAGSAVGYITGKIDRAHKSDYDLVIIGAGPAGISAALAAKASNLRFILLEQYSLAASIANNPKKKILLNGDINLPLAGRLKLRGTDKSYLISLFHDLVVRFRIPVQENCRVESIIKLNNSFNVISSDLQNFTTAAILLAIGKRGSPRKLNVPGESKEKVTYSVPDPDNIKGERILIVGGNNTAVESALILAGQNEVTLACHQAAFSELTPLTGKLINKASLLGSIRVLFSTKVMLIEENHVLLSTPEGYIKLYNDLVFILHGGDSAESFLEKAGISAAGVFAEEYHRQ